MFGCFKGSKSEKLRYTYTDNLQGIVTHSTREKKKEIHAAIDKYIGDYQALKSKQGGPSAAREFLIKAQKLIDQSLNTSTSLEVTCMKGCCFCCHMQVHITEDEAQLLALMVKRKNINYSKKRLKKQSVYTMDSWGSKTFAEKKCIFLNDQGACEAYEYRPINCRKLLVLSSPKNCEGQDKIVERFLDLEVSILATAILTCCTRGTLPNMFRNKLSSMV